MLKITQLPTSFGVRLEFDHTPSATEDIELIRSALADYQLVVLRGIPLTANEQVALMAGVGNDEITVQLAENGSPRVAFVSNQRTDRIDAAGALQFHCDLTYNPSPFPAVSLYGQDVSAASAPTLFASAAAAMKTLPTELRERLRTLEAVHVNVTRREQGEAGKEGPDRCVHPAIRRNPLTQTEALFVNYQLTSRIAGLPDDESDALLDELFAHLYQPSNTYTHQYEVGDLVIWDNFCVQHSRPNDNGGARTLRRVALTSDQSIGSLYIERARAAGRLPIPAAAPAS